MEALFLASRGQTDPERQLLNFLSDKKLLLVLDSFEHLLAENDERLSWTAYLGFAFILTGVMAVNGVFHTRSWHRLRGATVRS
jgi:hypothetical protein